ncbi:MAG: HAD family phosphatase [Phycisphaerae bacterium]|jgi:beta-phosphoglucomutase-like phosphatase (HAD superfamily)
MSNLATIASIGDIPHSSGMIKLEASGDGRFRTGENGVKCIVATGDRKVEFISFGSHSLAYVKSALGYPAYYPVNEVKLEKPVKAILMDLDGTSVQSENFWIWIIEKTTANLLNNPGFRLEDADLPFVSGHSVSEHLQYCIRKYCPAKTVEEARKYYFKHTNYEMNEILEGRGKEGAFTPSPGLREFLNELKSMGIKIGLVTSGLYEKAWPEILSAFRTLKMGDPKDFYDAIITAGFPLRKGEPGTLGELSPKPHPWLYSEVCRIGLGLGPEESSHVVGIEDSAAGVCSIRLAGFPVIGFGGGNIKKSGTIALCHSFCNSFEEVLRIIK